MTEIEKLKTRIADLEGALLQADKVVSALIYLASAASAVMQHVDVAMRDRHPEIADQARAFVARWAEFHAGADAAKAEAARQTIPPNFTRN